MNRGKTELGYTKLAEGIAKHSQKLEYLGLGNILA